MLKQKQKPVNEIVLQFPSHGENEAFARAAAGAFLVPADPTVEELSDVKTAVSEAVTNAIVHGYPADIGTITLTARRYEDGMLELIVEDQGVGIPDIRKAREPMFTTGGEERSGMGFTIMEHFMTYLDVESQPGKGTRVTMSRRLSGGTEA